jgi:hypothetical protein
LDLGILKDLLKIVGKNPFGQATDSPILRKIPHQGLIEPQNSPSVPCQSVPVIEQKPRDTGSDGSHSDNCYVGFLHSAPAVCAPRLFRWFVQNF